MPRLASPTLFWRTFLLIALLIAASLVAWLQSFRVFEREPRAQQIAQQIVSIVNITRSALLYSDADTRRELLADLADNEGIRIVPLEPADQVTDFPDWPLVKLVSAQLIERLGPGTRMASAVNGVPGNWVSFNIDEDAYWVYIERDPLARDTGTRWVAWAAVAMTLSLLVAVAITRVVNLPLKRLAVAAHELGAGRAPARLPEVGPREIRMLNQSFNRMVGDLAQLEQDRAVLLAGISHDLRTPLTRLRLELDINELPASAREAMIGDIEQMDAIVGQFLDYARAAPQLPREQVDLPELVDAALARARLDADLSVDAEPGLLIEAHATELARALDNLLTNAARYGRSPDTERLNVRIEARRDGHTAVIAVSDQGPGITPADIDRLTRPFERGDTARSGTRGAGLGLAIVARIARLHEGELRLLPNVPNGLRAELRLPAR